MNAEYLIKEIHQCEKLVEEYAVCFGFHENECPADFKLVMLVNGWHSPFVALNELLKRIDTNEMLLKRAKKNGAVFKYKSRYREMCTLVKNKSDSRGRVENKEE